MDAFRKFLQLNITWIGSRWNENVSPDLNSSLIDEIVNRGFTDLLPEIEKLDEHNAYYNFNYSDIEAIKHEISLKDLGIEESFWPDIFKVYENALNSWEYYQAGLDLLTYDEIRIKMDKKWRGTIDAPFDSHRYISDESLPYIADEKIGRNDPCTCGSGKKYIKCCLKE